MSLQNIGIGVAVVLSVIAIALGIASHGGSHLAGNLTQTNLQTNAPANATSFVGPYGVESDAGFFDAKGAASSLLGSLTMAGGNLVYDSVNSTTTPASLALQASDVTNYNSVIDTPTVSKNITITFPASSTLASFLPAAGEWSTQCWYNATGTAATYIVFAAGTGEQLTAATTTVSGTAGVKEILTQDSACFTFMRNGGTGSKDDDFSIMMSAFQ